MNKILFEYGFTLMELIVVIVIISIMLVFTMPELSGIILQNDDKTTINWIIVNASKLKNDAVNRNTNFLMCINQDTNTISIKEGMQNKEGIKTKKDIKNNKKKSTLYPDLSDYKIISEFLLPKNISLDGVEFHRPGQNFNPDDNTCIEFNKKGYSDYAIIYISDNDGKTFSCVIQPFLNKVKIYQGYVQFEELP